MTKFQKDTGNMLCTVEFKETKYMTVPCPDWPHTLAEIVENIKYRLKLDKENDSPMYPHNVEVTIMETDCDNCTGTVAIVNTKTSETIQTYISANLNHDLLYINIITKGEGKEEGTQLYINWGLGRKYETLS